MNNWLFKYFCDFREVRISNKYYVNSIYIFELVTNSVNVITFFYNFIYTPILLFIVFFCDLYLFYCHSPDSFIHTTYSFHIHS